MDEKPFYKRCFEYIRNLRTVAPEKARAKLRNSGLRLVSKAIEVDDLETAHQLLDWGVFDDFDEKQQPDRWLANAWYKFPSSDDAESRADFIAELQRVESCMKFARHWDAMLGLAVALQEKELAWKYAQKGGRVRQWGKPGEKWTFSRLLHHTTWEDVRNSYRARCFFDDWGLEYELMLAEIVYDTMKRLAPMGEDVRRDDYQLIYESADAELFFRPIMDFVDRDVWLECSYYGADACPFSGPVCTGPSWERIAGMKVDSDFAGMFLPGELIGAALADYAFEFGFGSDQIRDPKIRRSFAARLGALYRKHPRPKNKPDRLE